MHLLHVPLPPQLEQAAGWAGGDARWLSLCWTCCGDCPWMDDGRTAMTGNPWGFLAWRRHHAVTPALGEADLGNSERDGTQRLVIDRQDRQVYLCRVAEARAIVCDQWPVEEVAELTAEEWRDVAERVRQAMLDRPLPSMAQLMAQLREHSRLVGQMVRWLDIQAAERVGAWA